MFSKDDEQILLSLAREVRTAADKDEALNDEKRRFWFEHTSLKGKRPAVFVHPDGSWNEFLPYSSLKCVDGYAKWIELDLRKRLFRYEYIPDDVPIEKTLHIEKVYTNTWWGVLPKRETLDTAGSSWHHVPLIESPEDWDMLSSPVVTYCEEETKQRWEYMQNLFGDILTLDLCGVKLFNFHLAHYYCDYRGLENMFMDFILDPQTVHKAIGFFTDGIISMFRQMENQGLVSLNNDDTFHYTGGIGYNNELPIREGFDENHVRLCDVWSAAEAQELDPVSPEMHEEFILSYERKVLSMFGFNGYGCCDNLAKKLPNVLKIKNLRRVAVCPWADTAEFLPVLKDKYIMTWKPQPAYLATDTISEDMIRTELNNGIRKARGGRLELILRDTHTVRKDAARFEKWINITRDAIERNWC